METSANGMRYGIRLSCGCVPGLVLCGEAQRLYREQERVRVRIMLGQATVADWEAARQAYNDHMVAMWSKA